MRDWTIENTSIQDNALYVGSSNPKLWVFSTIEQLNNPEIQSKFCGNLSKKGNIIKNKVMDYISEEDSDSDWEKSSIEANVKFPTIVLNSSAFMNFNTMFRFPNHSKILLDGWFMEKFRDNCIELTNPKWIKLIGARIKNNSRSGVVVEWDNNLEETPKCKVVEMDGCEFSYNKLNGIEIYWNEFAAQNLTIELKNSKFSNNIENGAFIARMALTNLTISDWKMEKNGAKGLIIRSIHSRTNKPKFHIQNSKFNRNKEIGMLIEDSGVQMENVEWSLNSWNGLDIIGTQKPAELSSDVVNFLVKRPMNIYLDSVKMNENKVWGIKITDYWKGKITILKSIISNNFADGILLSNTYTELQRIISTSEANDELQKMDSMVLTLHTSTFAKPKSEFRTKGLRLPLNFPFEKWFIDETNISSNKNNGINMK